jgi:hypothetical protein
MTEAEKIEANRKITHVHRLEKLISLKCPYNTNKSLSKFSATSMEILMTFFIETVKTMLRFMGTTKDSECSKQS